MLGAAKSAQFQIPVQKSREASHNTLDEATFDLLHLSSLPDATIPYNSTSHIQPFADSIQKSSSTNSINKVIRTKVNDISSEICFKKIKKKTNERCRRNIIIYNKNWG